MPLFETIPIDVEVVRAVVKENWDITLGTCLKQSQNHTFVATAAAAAAPSGAATTTTTTTAASASEPEPPRKFIVRVTPDPASTRHEAIAAEVELLVYLREHGLPVCGPVASRAGSYVVRSGSLVVCAFDYAPGEPVVYHERKWTTDEHAEALGAWMGSLHALTRRFVAERRGGGSGTRGFREWTELHDGILRGVDVHPDDQARARDERHYGIIHGDVNPSNYHWHEGAPCMFDWDQAQRSWFLYDLAQPIWATVMLVGAGDSKDIGGPSADEAAALKRPATDPLRFTDSIIVGYEKAVGSPVDRPALWRMVNLRRQLYARFCRKALSELDPASEMGKFCTFVSKWMDVVEANPPRDGPCSS
ncbi:Rab5 GDP/GTP exchange factor [Pelomyxa schiedti]|nr:Rab5 GDP/GTP exchange factor [Pelomyxa schiedti]